MTLIEVFKERKKLSQDEFEAITSPKKVYTTGSLIP